MLNELGNFKVLIKVHDTQSYLCWMRFSMQIGLLCTVLWALDYKLMVVAHAL